MKHMYSKKTVVVFYLLVSAFSPLLQANPTKIDINAHIRVLLHDEAGKLLISKGKDVFQLIEELYQKAQTDRKFAQDLSRNVVGALIPILYKQSSELENIGIENLKEALKKVIIAFCESSKEFLQTHTSSHQELVQALDQAKNCIAGQTNVTAGEKDGQHIEKLMAVIQPELCTMVQILHGKVSVSISTDAVTLASVGAQTIHIAKPLLDIFKNKLAQTLSAKDSQTLALFIQSQTYKLLKQNTDKIIAAIRKSVTSDVNSQLDYMLRDFWAHIQTTASYFLTKIKNLG